MSLNLILKNIISCKLRPIRISIKDCIAESGHTYGVNGSHFFIKALQECNDDYDRLFSYLQSYYARFRVLSFDEAVEAKSQQNERKMYFLPWEEERIRPLSKFMSSHKFGPTDDESLKLIIMRLLNLLKEIKFNGFRQFGVDKGLPQVVKMWNNGNFKYLVKDGQHRLAIASYLKKEKIWVRYADHFVSVIETKNISKWAKVRTGLVTKEEALKYFNIIFNNKYPCASGTLYGDKIN